MINKKEIVKIPVYENSKIIPNKYNDLDNLYGYIDINNNIRNAYDSNKDYGNIIFEYEKEINNEYIIFDKCSNYFIDKIIISKKYLQDFSLFIYIEINKKKYEFIKDKELDNYYIYNSININIFSNNEIEIKLYNYYNNFLGENIKDNFNIKRIKQTNDNLIITLDSDVIDKNIYMNETISFNYLNTNNIEINNILKKISSKMHKIIDINNNEIVIENNDSIFDINVSGYIYFESLQHFIYLKGDF